MHNRDTEQQVEAAQQAALRLANVGETARNEALRAVADTLRANETAILAANDEDVTEAETLLAEGEYTQALVDRLKLDAAKLEEVAEMVESVADQADPLDRTLAARRLDDGLDLYRVSVPIGVVGTIFESRPDALVQIAALALKSGNAVILKGGSEASESNQVLYRTVVEAVAEVDAIPEGWAQLVEAHEAVDRVLGMDDAVDLVMPRGSSEFVSYVEDNTQIPVLGHTEGVCHVYVDEAADLELAGDVAVDAKVQYPAVCNAVETLLVHEGVAEAFLPAVVDRYEAAGVTLRGDAATREVVDIDPVTDEDWATEYGDLELAVGVVEDVYDAIDHVNTYGSKHTEAVLTEDD
ncbi:MAG: glutamate-5-semialdehyde dehydrogenase, partial [Salinirussus sp.]